MGWHNPPLPWQELERKLSGEPSALQREDDGSDSSSSERKQSSYPRPADSSPADSSPAGSRNSDAADRVPYAELHCHSNFSFLDGASHPEELVEEAAGLGLDAVALTDHDGMHGAVRFAEAAAEAGMRTVFGTELSFGLDGPQNGVADPTGEHLLLLAKDVDGYANLCAATTEGLLAGHDGESGRETEKGRPVYDVEQVAARVRGSCVALTGCRKGSVRSALVERGKAAAGERLGRLVDLFGADAVYVELIDSGMPCDSEYNDALAELATEFGLSTVATGAVHYARPANARLAQSMAAIRARRGLDEMAGWQSPAGTAHLRSGAEMAARFARYPEAVQRAALLGMECAFDLTLVAPRLPPFDVGEDGTEAGLLREKVYSGAESWYGNPASSPEAYGQLEHELGIVEKLGFPGYFLIVADIVAFCRANNILCQGRGSAANSAICFVLGITKVDSVRWKLLFERFLAPERDGYPDIDLDIESDRREEVIQYVYRSYGRLCSAQVANVITYRPRSAVRDSARALGYSPGQQDAWSKQLDRRPKPAMNQDVADQDHDIPDAVLELAAELEDCPRHLGIHPGGMVICDRPVSEVCPIEWARMDDRSVLQWDKDDCATAGLVKFDLLGLGMLSALHYMIDLVAGHKGENIDLGALDLDDDEVYAMLRRADAVGVFQVESRAQLATLPRLAPKEFYDLAVEVALIRPGPIQGGSVHPYIRRHSKAEPWEHEHPLLAGALDKTLGVPLFQEQLMRIATDVANFTAAEADELRHAMGSKRATKKMRRLRARFHEGAAENGLDEQITERIYQKMVAFADFGFPESHALSFAHLVFASAYFKRYHPDAFCAGLLRAQPMGFYSPQSLVADARRHGVTVRGPDINASSSHTTLERAADDVTVGDSAVGDSAHAVRLGLGTVRLIGQPAVARLVEERARDGPFVDMGDVVRRTGLATQQVESLATAGAFGCFETDRRKALWTAGAVAGEHPDKLPTGPSGEAPTLPGMAGVDLAAADVWATGVSPASFPTQFIRDRLDALGVVPARETLEIENGRRVLIGGAVTHRQRPATAGGVTFLNIEDETGMVNVICTPGLWQRYRRIARSSPALLIRGTVEQADGAVSVLADRLQHLPMRIPSESRDFH